jgi:hypothetical protein
MKRPSPPPELPRHAPHRNTRRPQVRSDDGHHVRDDDVDVEVADDGEARTFALLDDGGDRDFDEAARGTTWREDELHLDPRLVHGADPWPSDPRAHWSPQDLYPQGGFDDAFGWDMRVGGAAPIVDDHDPEAAWDLNENNTFYAEEFGGGAHNARRSVEPQVRARNRGPKGYVRSDQRIHEDVCEALAGLDVDLGDVEVSVSHGEVSLSGTVDDRLSRYRLEQRTLAVRGVKEIDNKLRLRHRAHPHVGR